jgi:hypothetical protein
LKAFPLILKLDLELLDIHLQTGECLGFNQVLQVLRILTAVRFTDPVSVFNRLALSDAIYLLERQLLSSQEQDKASRASSFGINIQQPFRLATFLYVDMVLREMHSINIGGLAQRLTETLQTIFEDDHFQLKLLIVTFYFGFSSLEGCITGQWGEMIFCRRTTAYLQCAASSY